MKKILKVILVTLIVIFVALLYSRFLGTIGLSTNEYVINSATIGNYKGLKIVHFSDIHYKKIITEDRVIELVKQINLTKPDLVLFTGDLLDSDYEMTNTDTNFLIKQLSKIEATYGAYAILGDQDQSQEEIVKNIYLQSNFTLLDNKAVIIQNKDKEKILLGGVNSYLADKADIKKVMTSVEDTDICYKIILVHEPDYITEITDNYRDISLVVAGHTINGSINIPFLRQILMPNGGKKVNKAKMIVGGTKIYISNGIGVDKVNFRLFNRPSFNLYRLTNDN